jgi:hypothetical protein
MNRQFDRERPLMLWCSSHDTLASEEIPLFLEAGYRVVPLYTNFWTFEFDPSLDQKICDDWKTSVDLPQDVVDKLVRLQICAKEGMAPLLQEDIDLLNQYVDVIYITVLPALAVELTKRFRGTVVFRPFGHGSLNNYSRVARGMGADLNDLNEATNFIWCPILSTLQEPEDLRLYRNAQLLTGFVSHKRLGGYQWQPEASEKCVIETIPRIEWQAYYTEVYKDFVNNFGDLPIKILGGNSKHGDKLKDPRIVGRLEGDEYYRVASQSRVSIYHGDSRHHVHYHPIEFMSLGVPVLFQEQCAITVEAVRCGLDPADLKSYGMYRDVSEAREMAKCALENIDYAIGISQRQRFFVDEVFDRKKALAQARWLRSLCVSINYGRRDWKPGQFNSITELAPESRPKVRAPWPTRVKRELGRVGRKLRKALRSRDESRKCA